MAVVKITRYGGPNGAIVKICDDDCNGRTEMDRARLCGQAVYNMLENQIARGHTPVSHKVETIPMSEREILYERSAGNESEELFSEESEVRAGTAG